MAGRSFSASGCAAIFGRISGCQPVARYHNVYGPLGTLEAGAKSAGGGLPEGHQAKRAGMRSRFGAGRADAQFHVHR